MPALPLDDAGPYVAAAYLVFVVLLIVYVGIMAARLGHLSREIESLADLAERRDREREQGLDREPEAEAEHSSEEAPA